MFSHSTSVAIQFGDCDPAGIVYYPNYFRMFDNATAAMLSAAFGMHKRNWLEQFGIAGIPMVDTGAKFFIPSQLRRRRSRSEARSPNSAGRALASVTRFSAVPISPSRRMRSASGSSVTKPGRSARRRFPMTSAPALARLTPIRRVKGQDMTHSDVLAIAHKGRNRPHHAQSSGKAQRAQRRSDRGAGCLLLPRSATRPAPSSCRAQAVIFPRVSISPSTSRASRSRSWRIRATGIGSWRWLRSRRVRSSPPWTAR